MMIEMRMVDTDCDGISNDKAEDMTRDGMPTWYEKEYGVAEGGWQHPYLHNARYGLLLGTGDFPSFWNDPKNMHDKLVEDYNYIEDNVYLNHMPVLDEELMVGYYGDGNVNVHFKLEIDGEEKFSTVDPGDEKEYWVDDSIKFTNNDARYDFDDFEYYVDELRETENLFFKLEATDLSLNIGFFRYFWSNYSYGDLMEPFDSSESPSELFERSLEQIGNRISKTDYLFVLLNSHGSDMGHLEVSRPHDEVKSDYDDFYDDFDGGYYYDYGWDGKNYLRKEYDPIGGKMSYTEVSEMFDEHIGSRYSRMSIVVQSCFSGTAIEPLSKDTDGNERDQLIIITAASEDEKSSTTWGSGEETTGFLWEGVEVRKTDGEYEVVWEEDGFIPGLKTIVYEDDLKEGTSLQDAFEDGKDAARENGRKDDDEYSSTAQIHENPEGLAEYTYL